MLWNHARNAWNTVPQDSRRTPAALPHHSRTDVAGWVASFSGPWGGQVILQPFFWEEGREFAPLLEKEENKIENIKEREARTMK